MEPTLTSIELIEITGISRATLNNYISLGILPSPEVGAPPEGMGRTRRVGYFPHTAVDIVNRVAELKRQGVMMSEIAERIYVDWPVDTPSLALSSSPSVALQEREPFPSIKEKSSLTSEKIDNGKLHLTLDQLSYPAYLVNPQFQLEWCNEHAEEEIFGSNSNFSRNITERSIFTLLLQSNILDRLTEGEEFIRFHMTLAKGRLSSSSLLSQGSELSQKHSDLLARLYHEVGAASDEEGILTIEINLTELHQGNDSQQHFNVYASFFREGIFFSYIPVTDEQQSLQSYLSRRDQVIAQLLRKRQPYLTPLAVVIADLQNSTKICAELPPEEYFDLINQVWGSMEPLLRKYRATHGKHAGDGVVYYFLPQADSNYALNAVQFTIEMKQIIKRLSREWQQKKNWFNELHLNVGIDEGTEWFGTYQTSTHIEFTALGDTVNQAGRLSDFAKNGSIWVSKRLMSNLPSTTRDKIHYGIRRESPGGEEHVISSTYSRVESLIKHDSLQWNKMHDIAMIAVTEIIDVSL